jgi:hypothetical protein
MVFVNSRSAVGTGEQPKPQQDSLARLPPRQMYDKCSHANRCNDGAKDHQREILA